ncbi:methyltransferase domain-containing protein [Pedobacter nutrimenti]|jgi:SAM-dependent methyltransferase|uniref:Methyltransferase family protein n=1 Tax=Pedobacter nutrimenti TaxID=1241337 RepID=A0A318UE13_9SPHI|nr:methyltransferase domain-containing protein [Pedobacter nutrimenti]PYF74323.1 methyltransferase family protein [Pedobacter nutrimenti]
MQPSWKQHNDQFSKIKLPASAPLCQAFEHVEQRDNDFYAADLGCGSGIDTLAMLEKGWKVLAIDKDEASLENLKTTKSALLETQLQSFEKLNLPQLDLINASMSLPFCDPLHFNACWQSIRLSLKTQGFFCGHFFGPKDSWSSRPGMTFLTKAQLNALLKGFEILWMDEKEKEGKTLSGMIKNWHVFSVLARKS